MAAKNFEFPVKTWPQIVSDKYKSRNDVPVHLRDIYGLRAKCNTMGFVL